MARCPPCERDAALCHSSTCAQRGPRLVDPTCCARLFDQFPAQAASKVVSFGRQQSVRLSPPLTEEGGDAPLHHSVSQLYHLPPAPCCASAAGARAFLLAVCAALLLCGPNQAVQAAATATGSSFDGQPAFGGQPFSIMNKKARRYIVPATGTKEGQNIPLLLGDSVVGADYKDARAPDNALFRQLPNGAIQHVAVRLDCLQFVLLLSLSIAAYLCIQGITTKTGFC